MKYDPDSVVTFFLILEIGLLFVMVVNLQKQVKLLSDAVIRLMRKN